MVMSFLMFRIAKKGTPLSGWTIAFSKMMMFVLMFRAAKERTSAWGGAPHFQGR
jgi:hypothetical protein